MGFSAGSGGSSLAARLRPPPRATSETSSDFGAFSPLWLLTRRFTLWKRDDCGSRGSRKTEDRRSPKTETEAQHSHSACRVRQKSRTASRVEYPTRTLAIIFISASSSHATESILCAGHCSPNWPPLCIIQSQIDWLEWTTRRAGSCELGSASWELRPANQLRAQQQRIQSNATDENLGSSRRISPVSELIERSFANQLEAAASPRSQASAALEPTRAHWIRLDPTAFDCTRLHSAGFGWIRLDSLAYFICLSSK